MRTEFFHGVKIALELFFRKQLVNLRVTRATQANDRFNSRPIELPLVPFVVMARTGDEMMSR